MNAIQLVEKALIKKHEISSDRSEAIYQIAQLMILEKTLHDLVYHQLDPQDITYGIHSVELEVDGKTVILGNADDDFPLIAFFAFRFKTETSLFNVTETDLKPIYDQVDQITGLEIETQSLAFHRKDRTTNYQVFQIEQIRKIIYELD